MNEIEDSTHGLVVQNALLFFASDDKIWQVFHSTVSIFAFKYFS